MTLRRATARLVLLAFLTLNSGTSSVFAAGETRSITLTQKLQIPGAVLKPGTYMFSIEDRLTDRAIVRIISAEKNKYYLVLSVPSGKVSGQGQDGLVLFDSKDGKKRVLRGWMCPGCSTTLEFVYPKLEAVKITDESTQSVLAFDHEYDKLPANLSADDMKVVSLWILSPERITAENKGQGVKAAKYSVPANGSPVETAQSAQTPISNQMARTAPPSSGQEPPRRHLPKTASNTFSLALWGVLSLLAWAGLRFTGRRKA